jgi:hypothetical protein
LTARKTGNIEVFSATGSLAMGMTLNSQIMTIRTNADKVPAFRIIKENGIPDGFSNRSRDD